MSKTEQQMFYVQDSRNYVGNSPLWWAKGCGGYTCDIEKAELFTEDKAMELFNSRSTDIPWKKKDVEKAIKRLVDAQYLVKSNEDGFYTRLKQLEEEKSAEEERVHKLESLKRYKEEELFAILEHMYSAEEIREWTDFSIVFDEAKKKMEWHEYYYPTAYYKSDEELFNDLIEYGFLFKCSECERYFSTHKRDDEYKELCESCGEERWLKKDEEQEVRKQLETFKEEIYSTLGTTNQQKMIHGFESNIKLKQYEVVCALPAMSDDVFDYIGYPVQIRIKAGTFGSNKILFRKADGDLITWENQSFLALTKEQKESILPIFKKLIEEDKSNKAGYSISDGEKMVAFLVDGVLDDASVSSTTTTITVKNVNGSIKEQTAILG